MKEHEMGEKGIGRIVITQEQIRQRAAEVGAQITKDHEGEDLLMVGILKGAVLWMADLVKEVKLPITLVFMVVSS